MAHKLMASSITRGIQESAGWEDARNAAGLSLFKNQNTMVRKMIITQIISLSILLMRHKAITSNSTDLRLRRNSQEGLSCKQIIICLVGLDSSPFII